MEIGHTAKRTLVPTLMEWAGKTRLKKHLVPDSIFCMWLGDYGLQIHLSNLSSEYQHKHIIPNFKHYCALFIRQIIPVLKSWCTKNNIHNIEMVIRFSCQEEKLATTITLNVPKDNKEGREYLENKST